MAAACSPGKPYVHDTGIAVHTEGCDPFGQDDGEASFYIPLARVNWAWPQGVLFHNWATTALSGHEAGFKGACFAGESMTLAALALLEDPATVEAAKAELAGRVGGRLLSPPRVGGFATMTEDPQSFWDATWIGDRGLAG